MLKTNSLLNLVTPNKQKGRSQMQVPVTINIYSSKPDKNGHVVKTKTFSIIPSPNSRSMGYLVGYVQAQNDHGCRVEVV